MLFLKLNNKGKEITMMVGGEEITMPEGISWVKKGLAEFLIMKEGCFEIASAPVDCTEDGVPLIKIKNLVADVSEKEILEMQQETKKDEPELEEEKVEEVKIETVKEKLNEVEEKLNEVEEVKEEKKEEEVLEVKKVTATEEDKEKYRKELSEMSREQLWKLCEFKSLQFDKRKKADKLIELLINNL